MKNLFFAMTAAFILSACSDGNYSEPNPPLPIMKGSWVASDQDNSIGKDVKLVGLHFKEGENKTVYFCGETMRGFTGYKFDGKTLKINSIPFQEKSKSGPWVPKQESISVEVSKSPESMKLGKSTFKRFKGDHLEYQSAVEFCGEVEQKTKLKMPPFTCREECLSNSAFCLSVSKNGFKEYHQDFDNLFALAQSSKFDEEGEFSLGTTGTMEKSFWLIGGSSINFTLAPTLNVPVVKLDSPYLELKITDSKKAPVLEFEDKYFQEDWGGRMTKVEFINKDPVFQFGSARCIHIKE